MVRVGVMQQDARKMQKSPAQKIPATVVTGFLGAGKTTLIRHLITNANGRRIALIVNEFGEVGIDGDLLKSCGAPDCGEDDIVELANGCLCCTVADDFLPTLQKLLDRPNPPTHIVIETSGLALPKPLVQAFAWPGIRSRTTVDGVITVVDAAAETLPAEPWDGTTWKAWTQQISAKTGAKGKALFHPLRLALTGRDKGPEMAPLLPLIGRDRVAKRLSGV